MSAECKKLRGPNDTGPDCGCRGDACALGRDAATTPARDLLDWNGVLPNVRIVEEEHGATPTFMVVADYGWAERILCGGCYLQDAETILAALNEVMAHGIPEELR